MRTTAEKVAALRAFNDSVLDNEPDLADAEGAAAAHLEVARSPEGQLFQESIIMRRRRPVLAIKDGATVLDFQDPHDIVLWKKQLEDAAGVLKPTIPSVGRVELTGNPDFSWVGTGWLVHPRFMVTNRHVAEEFSRADGDRFLFHSDMSASLDMLQEIGSNKSQVFDVKGVSYIEQRPGLDLAFLEVEQIDGSVLIPITLSKEVAAKGDPVATIGYPAFDSRIPEPDLMKEIYGEIFDKKRLAPGVIAGTDKNLLLHNCTTLGGNSGSVVLDLKTGEALGLHFSGSFLRNNFAVRADRVKERLDALLAGTLRNRREGPVRSRPSRRPAPIGSAVTGCSTITVGNSSGNSASITVPLTITVSLGDVSGPATARRPAAKLLDDDGDDTGGDRVADEARPEDYRNRKGYDPAFLGSDMVVDLPKIIKGKSDILTWGDGNTVLPYEHFSVLMNAKRRQCFYSACNIDGERSKSSNRTEWRFDPRIPKEMQIMKECYGSAPKFSRGHMTRREDPAWGSSKTIIQRGADDSMHVTNVTPQMQSFNAPIWLALEDYALQHTREDDQKISVFTGPYFAKNDPTMFGVRIPVKFWKIIAFVHDETGELCATGYEMSQENNLVPSEFVFGDFVSPQLNASTQVLIASIETRAGISFGDLADIDALSDEALEAPVKPLLFPEQIRFI